MPGELKYMQYVVVFISTPNRKEAEEISRILLDNRVIACGNIIKGVDSRFWWKGKKEKARECLLIAKTTRPLIKRLVKIVKSIHPYEVPEIIAIPIVGGYKRYLDWIGGVTGKEPQTRQRRRGLTWSR